MHLLTSFIGPVGNLMSNTGIADILCSGFAGVAKMMIGKKFPMCMRALWIVVEMILAQLITNLNCYDDPMEVLPERAAKSKTCKLWLNWLIKPVFILTNFVRAKREGDWALHLKCVRTMMPYFFAPHHNYARSGLV